MMVIRTATFLDNNIIPSEADVVKKDSATTGQDQQPTKLGIYNYNKYSYE